MRQKKTRRHILFIVENNTVPPDIRVWREAKVAKQAGFMVSVIAPTNPIYDKHYEIVEGIEIYRHFSFEHQKGVYGQVFEYLSAFFWEAYLAAKIYLKSPFQVIHAANPPDNIFLIALFFKMLGVKFIFDHHDLSPELFISKFKGSSRLIFQVLRSLEKLSCKSADCIISTNNSFRNHVIKVHRVGPQKVFVVRNDPEVEPLPKPSYKRKNLINLLYVGAINVQDGVDLLIETIHTLVSKFHQSEIRCTVVGDGEGLKSAKQLSRKLGIQEFIEFTGYVYDRQLVKRYINEADICIESAPDSAANRRSTFIKIMEYMACGKPIVAFDLKETRSSVGDTAILVEPGNLYEFAKAINELLGDPEKRQALGRKAYNRVLNHLNWQKSSDTLEEIYENLP